MKKLFSLIALLALLVAPATMAQQHRFDSLLGPNVGSIQISNSVGWLTNTYPMANVPQATNTPGFYWTNAAGTQQLTAVNNATNGDYTPLLGDAMLNPFRDCVSQTNITIAFAVKGGAQATGGLTFKLAPIWWGEINGGSGPGLTQGSPYVDNNTNFVFNFTAAASQYVATYTNIVIPPGVKALRLLSVQAPTSGSYYQLYGIGIPSWQQ